MDGRAAVYLATEEEHYFTSLVEQRGDVEEVPEGIAVLTVVEEELDCFFAAFD